MINEFKYGQTWKNWSSPLSLSLYSTFKDLIFFRFRSDKVHQIFITDSMDWVSVQNKHSNLHGNVLCLVVWNNVFNNEKFYKLSFCRILNRKRIFWFVETLMWLFTILLAIYKPQNLYDSPSIFFVKVKRSTHCKKLK